MNPEIFESHSSLCGKGLIVFTVSPRSRPSPRCLFLPGQFVEVARSNGGLFFMQIVLLLLRQARLLGRGLRRNIIVDGSF